MKTPHERHSPSERRALTVRVRKVSGQLRAIEKMVEDDTDCTEILMQLVSARRGLKSLAEAILHSHLHHCIGEARESADAHKQLRELLNVLERYVE